MIRRHQNQFLGPIGVGSYTSDYWGHAVLQAPSYPTFQVRNHHHHWMVWWHQPHYGVVDYSSVTAPVASATTPAPCNCLTKQYLQDGSVLFTDLCTKEEAMATPAELQAQAQGVSPQAQ